MLRSLIQKLVLVLACILSGSLECGRPALSATQSQGADVYFRMCAVCHGRTGEGYRADEATALRNQEFLSSVSDDYLRKVILEGRKDTVMSAWSIRRGGPLSDADVDGVIAFLRRWQLRPHVSLDERLPRGNAERGEHIYQERCNGCHGARGVTGPNVHIGDGNLLATATNGFLRHAIRYGRPGTKMPAFEQPLNEQGIEDVVALLRNWQPRPTPHAEPPIVRPAPLALGPVPLNPRGPEPRGFKQHPERTSMNVVKPELERGARMALLDARTPSDYMLMHIPGAVSVPFYDVDRYASQLPKDTWLVSYCSCPHAESGMLAAALVAKGFKKVTVLEEGLRGWNANHFETHKGPDP